MTERDDLPKDIEALQALVIAQRAQISSHAAEIERLKLIIAKLQRLQFGRRSEKRDREIEQLQLRLEELQILSQPAPVETSATERTTQPVRRPLPEHLPRERVLHEPTCTCPDCGAAMRRIGVSVL